MSSNATSASSSASTAAAPLIDSIEEDDVFPEFDPPHWVAPKAASGRKAAGPTPGPTPLGRSASQAQQADRMFQDDWDNEEVEEEFTRQLREELEKGGK